MSDYWTSTKSPPTMHDRRSYETPELEKHIRDNVLVCPTVLAHDVHLCTQTVMAYQRRLGLRQLTGTGK